MMYVTWKGNEYDSFQYSITQRSIYLGHSPRGCSTGVEQAVDLNLAIL